MIEVQIIEKIIGIECIIGVVALVINLKIDSKLSYKVMEVMGWMLVAQVMVFLLWVVFHD